MNQNDRKKEFLEILSKIKKDAAASNHTISKEEIHSHFKEILTDEKMYDMVHKYLTEAGITINGYEAERTAVYKETAESNQALAFHEMYLNEMNAISHNSSNTVPELLRSLIAGCPDAAGELSKLYLPLVLKLCGDFEHMGLTHSDLVAEGNLALYEAALEYASLPDKSDEQTYFEEYLCRRIKNALQAAVDAELGHCQISNHLAEQINALNNASTELAEDLGREATLEELCDRLSLGEDEIKQLMKITIDALSVIQTDEE